MIASAVEDKPLFDVFEGGDEDIGGLLEIVEFADSGLEIASFKNLQTVSMSQKHYRKNLLSVTIIQNEDQHSFTVSFVFHSSVDDLGDPVVDHVGPSVQNGLHDSGPMLRKAVQEIVNLIHG
ncbi:hypothetical protein HG530_008274 [Fusarium avenaceum]|nr:hypothetical protein HG530_008274 [Fusarium avenaceum]